MNKPIIKFWGHPRFVSSIHFLLLIVSLSACVGCGDASQLDADSDLSEDAGALTPASGPVVAVTEVQEPGGQAPPEIDRALALLDLAGAVEQFEEVDQFYKPQLLARAGRFDPYITLPQERGKTETKKGEGKPSGDLVG